MSAAAENAIRAWCNDPVHALAGDGNPLSRGAYLADQRSPADGPYAVLQRNSEGITSPVAEDSAVSSVRMQAMVYAGTVEAAETAAAALRSAFETLTGCPERCGDTGVLILVASNHIGPFFVPGTTEEFCFQVGADFLLAS